MQPRPESLPSITRKVRTSCGNLYVTITFDIDRRPLEVFAYLGKSGKCTNAQINALSIAISLGLRSGANANDYIDHLRQVRCPETAFAGMGDDDPSPVISCANAIVRVMKASVEDEYIALYIDYTWRNLSAKQ